MSDHFDKLLAWAEEQKAAGVSYNRQADMLGLNDSTYGDYRKKRVTTLEKISKPKRAMIFKVTGIDDFRFDGYEKYLPDGEKEAAHYRTAKSGARGTHDTQLTREISDEFRHAYEAFNRVFSARMKDTIPATYPPTLEQCLMSVTYLFYTLGEELETLKAHYPNDITMLRNTIAPEDVGYVTTFLDNAFKDERLFRWFNATPYTFKGPKK